MSKTAADVGQHDARLFIRSRSSRRYPSDGRPYEGRVRLDLVLVAMEFVLDLVSCFGLIL